MSSHISNERPAPDQVLVDIAEYALNYKIDSELAYKTARACLIDTLGCGLEALEYPACTKLLGPIVPGTFVPAGARVPGTNYVLDPVQAAFNIGAIIRWLDFNDTWLAAEWGHPSDNLGGILAVADWLSRIAVAEGRAPLTMRDVLTAMIKAHEIQGCIALENSFNKVGLDHVVLVKVASTAVVCQLLGLSREQTINALSLAWVDGQSLRTYRHAPNTGSRKSWAAGDATSRAVRLALMAKAGEMGYPSVLTAKTWGFYDVSFRGQPFKFQRPYGSYVMENVLFKISYPAEFHSQTAVECAMKLHQELAKRGLNASAIKNITVRTHEACIRIIDKKGPLANPADRDHCVQYMIAVPLLFGRLTAADYEDAVAKDPTWGPRIDALRDRTTCVEEPQFTHDYHDPEKRSIANSLRMELEDGTVLEETVEYPIGHRRRREEGMPLLVEKFRTNLARRFPDAQQQRILDASLDPARLDAMPVNEYVDLYIPAEDRKAEASRASHAVYSVAISNMPVGGISRMRFSSVVKMVAFAGLLLGFSMTPARVAAQSGDKVLQPADTQKLLPDNLWYKGQAAPAQKRNSGGVKFSDGSFVLATLVDTSGYSSDVQAKYQAYFITELPIKIAGHDIPAGIYGIGFIGNNKFIVTDVGAHDVFTADSSNDDAMKRPRPLQVTENEGGGFRLYAGRRYVTFNK